MHHPALPQVSLPWAASLTASLLLPQHSHGSSRLGRAPLGCFLLMTECSGGGRLELGYSSPTWALLRGCLCTKTPHWPGKDVLKAALQDRALPTRSCFRAALLSRVFRCNRAEALFAFPSNLPLFVLYGYDMVYIYIWAYSLSIYLFSTP